MAFGSWSSREGVYNDDPWNQKDPSEKRAVQCSHPPEPELKGSRPVRPAAGSRTRTGGGAGAQKRRVLVIVFAVIAVALVLSLIVPLILISSSGPFPAEPATPEADHSSGFPMDPGNYDTFQEFFEDYFQSGSGSGVNYLERTQPQPGMSLTLDEGAAERLTLQDVYDKCIPSIVAITADLDGSYYSWGTGVIFTEDGYIITNSHVLDDAVSATVTLYDDRDYPATLVGYDSFSDIAVIKIDCTGLTPAAFTSSEGLRVGDDVVAIGNPMGEELRGTMTNGIISAINREVSIDGNAMTLIQTNAQINEGNSGGALIDMSGRVIGITNMKMISYGSSVEGLGFAIPSSTVKPVVDEILDSGFVAGRPGIGVTVGGIPEAVQSQHGVPAGVYVSEVTPGSGADLAGIMPGDIITAADGIEVYSTADLNAVKGNRAVGESIVLTVWRDGETTDYEVELMDMNTLFH